MHYPRVPPELWHDRLLRLKRGGFNTVQTYAFWNFSEPREGQFDFTGWRDIGRYLAEAQKVGLYATVRAGPYVCAEWDSGGYPVWLKFKPNLLVRQDNPAYVAAQDAWLKQVLAQVAPHQINQGGNVILVQLENEGRYWGAWTTPSSGNPYFDHLRQDGIDDGLQVPFFMSGYHHGSIAFPENPGETNRQCPWISTEIWAGWYSNYGYEDYAFMRVITCNDKIMARGGDGQNYYMCEGGTNFDSWNDNESAASYDYGATISEAGQPRPQYFAEKENNLFATSFAGILGNATDAEADYRGFATNARLIGARKSPAGTVVFLRGLVKNADPAVVQGVGGGMGGRIDIPALRVAHIVLDAPIVPDARSRSSRG
jgi:beta-galactosidase